MACPHAKYIKGTIAYCSLVNKKVSTLRYPCKGNYRRCPIYVRYARARPAPAPRPAPAQAQREQEPPQARPPARQEPVEAPRVQEPARPSAPAPAPTPPLEAGGEFVPSEALCDSLVLASLIASATSVGVYRGPLRGVVEEARRHLSGEGFLFVVGRVGGYQFRAIYSGKVFKYTFEEAGKPLCGEDAEKLLRELGDAALDAVIYRVSWESIPLWRDRIREELQV